ncbi:MAG: fructose-bisphosphatase class I, partial [Campylobacteraceae bacterium]|nr:fructose-bisphosphatase class I [Campylobacteraceae bacterium]
MKQIIEAIEKSAIEIKELIETGDTSKSENENSTGDTQLKLDIASDMIIERI